MKITNKPKTPSLTKFVIFSFVMSILFAIVVVVSAWFTIDISDTLITCWYSLFGGEVLMCALIKIFKLKEDKDNSEEEDNEDGTRSEEAEG